MILQKINFENALKRLEEITSDLESGELTLDDSLKLFEEGIKLTSFCEKSLSSTEKKLEILKSTDIESFDENNDNENITDDNEKKNKSKKKTNKEIQENENNLENNEENFLF
jgi:exodeoxyribonuclease VII small subunit